MEYFLHRISFLCTDACALVPPLELRKDIPHSRLRFPGLYLPYQYPYLFWVLFLLHRFSEYCDVVPFLRRNFCCYCPPKVFLSVWERCGERPCILFQMYLITFFMFVFLICTRCFHAAFPQINFCYFSGEALSLLLACVYFAVLSLLVPTPCKTFCGRIWNSMLVPAVIQFAPQFAVYRNQYR